MEKSIEKYKKLEFVEKEFGVTFEPKVLLQNEEAWTDLEELYLTLKEKEVTSKRIGVAEGKFVVPDDFDACNDKIAEMFGEG